MIIKNTLIFIFIAVGIFFAIGQVSGEVSEKVVMRSYYEAVIDELISNCEYKESFMSESRSEHLRQAAAIGCLKAAYFKSHKEVLLDDLVAAEIGKRTYKIHYNLNRKFYSVLRTATTMVKH
jgi:hypothetical protein